MTSITKPGMTTNTFPYNGLDTRVSMTDSFGSKTFKRSGVGVTAPVLSDGQAQYSGLGSESRGGVKTYFHSALKNTDLQTSATQSVSASRVYDAFGNVVSSTGMWKSPFGNAGKFGYQEDQDSGLKLLGHRYYDSSTGRFLTRDPIKDGRNWYSYCGNSPVSYYDADGLRPRPLTDEEKGLVELAIYILFMTGEMEKALLLQEMLENGDTVADTDVSLTGGEAVTAIFRGGQFNGRLIIAIHPQYIAEGNFFAIVSYLAA